MKGVGPLAGFRVVEFAGLGPGPFAAMALGDLGADVVRIDRAGAKPWGAGGGLDRGRRSIAMDLKKTGAAAIALRLVAGADALIEGFRPGVMERLGLGPEPCLHVNPRLVYGRMTGFGQDGPLAEAPGHDINYLAVSGLLWPLGARDRPPAIPLNLVADFGGGGMMLALGVLAAAHAARATGRGQVVDAAMVEGAGYLGAMLYAMIGDGAWRVRREANMLDGGAPFYAVYATSDGGYVAVGALEPQFYAALIRGVGLADPRFARQWDMTMWPDLSRALTAVFATRTRAEWCAALEGTDACLSPVLDPSEASRHPHVRARRVFDDTAHGPQPAPAPRFSATPTRADRTVQAAGAATRALLMEAGLSAEAIDRAIAAGIVSENPP